MKVFRNGSLRKPVRGTLVLFCVAVSRREAGWVAAAFGIVLTWGAQRKMNLSGFYLWMFSFARHSAKMLLQLCWCLYSGQTLQLLFISRHNWWCSVWITGSEGVNIQISVEGLQFIAVTAKASLDFHVERGVLIKSPVLSLLLLACSSRFICSSSFAKWFSSLESSGGAAFLLLWSDCIEEWFCCVVLDHSCALWASGGGSEASFIRLCRSFGGVITVLITQLSSWSNSPQSISDLASLLQRVWPLHVLLLMSMAAASFLFNNSSCKTYLFLSTASKNRCHQLTHFWNPLQVHFYWWQGMNYLEMMSPLPWQAFLKKTSQGIAILSSVSHRDCW